MTANEIQNLAIAILTVVSIVLHHIHSKRHQALLDNLRSIADKTQPWHVQNRTEQGVTPMDQSHIIDGHRLTHAEKQARLQKAIDLRTAGGTWLQVAEACGWSNKQAAFEAVNAELRRRHRDISNSTEALRQQEVERLDTLTGQAFAILTNPGCEPAERLRAVDTINRLIDRRAKLLGLDAVQKVTVDGGLRVELVGVDLEGLK